MVSLRIGQRNETAIVFIKTKEKINDLKLFKQSWSFMNADFKIICSNERNEKKPDAPISSNLHAKNNFVDLLYLILLFFVLNFIWILM